MRYSFHKRQAKSAIDATLVKWNNTRYIGTMKVSPTQRSLKLLRDNGYTVAITEKNVRIPDKTVPGGWRIFKQDLFGFCDLLAVHPNYSGCLFVQTTAGLGSHRTERMAKIEQAEATPIILGAGNRIEFHGWRKKGPRGGVKRWEVARFYATLDAGKVKWVSQEEPDDDFDAQPALGFSKEDDF
jgi:hypothetical protein